MRRLSLWAILLLLFIPIYPAHALQQAEFEVKLTSPGEGSAVQGLVEILGTTKTDDFVDYEISFSIMTESEPTWFPVNYSKEAVDEAALAQWNTSTLSDGSYSIKLVVNLIDQDPIILIINNIRVRNYSPIETSTPAPTGTTNPEELPTETASPLPPTVTALPDNPAQIHRSDINSALKWGIGITLTSLVLIGLYVSRRKS